MFKNSWKYSKKRLSSFDTLPFSRYSIFPAFVKMISGKTDTCRAETKSVSTTASTATHWTGGLAKIKDREQDPIYNAFGNGKGFSKLTLGEGSPQFHIMCTAFSTSSLNFSFCFGLTRIKFEQQSSHEIWQSQV